MRCIISTNSNKLQKTNNQTMNEQIKLPMTVIGAGSWGTALALLLARNGNTVHLWGHDRDDLLMMQKQGVNSRYLPDFLFPENLHVKLELVDALHGVRDILIVVPSTAFHAVISRLVPLMTKKHRIVWGTKGLDAESCETLDRVAQQVLGHHVSLAVLSGPSFASEVEQGLPTALTLASNDEAFADELVARFSNDTFRLYKSNDLMGVEL